MNENVDEPLRIGSGAHGSIGPVFKKLCPDDEPRSFLTLYGDGKMTINYAWLKPEYRKDIAEKFSENPDLKIDFNADLSTAYPRYTRDQWSSNIDTIIDVIRGFLWLELENESKS